MVQLFYLRVLGFLFELKFHRSIHVNWMLITIMYVQQKYLYLLNIDTSVEHNCYQHPIYMNGTMKFELE